MKRAAWLSVAACVLAGFALSGCGSQQLPAQVVTVMETTVVTETYQAVETPIATVPPIATIPPNELIDRVMLHCGDKDIEVHVYSNRLEAVIDGRAVTLPQADAASGVRYVSGDTTIWNHHEDWSYITNEGAANEQWIDCTVR